MAIFAFEFLLIPCITPDWTNREFTCYWEQVSNADAVVLSIAIIHFTITTSADAIILVVEFIFNFAICVPAIISIATSIEV